MKIRTKLIIGFVTIALIHVFIGLEFMKLEESFSKTEEYHVKMSVPATNILFELKSEYIASEAYLLEYLQGVESAKAKFNEHQIKIVPLVDEYENLTYEKSSSGEFLANPMMQRQMLDFVKKYRIEIK